MAIWSQGQNSHQREAVTEPWSRLIPSLLQMPRNREDGLADELPSKGYIQLRRHTCKAGFIRGDLKPQEQQEDSETCLSTIFK